MARVIDAITLGIGPSAVGFFKRAEADIKKQKTPVIDIPLNPEFTRLRAEIAAERKRHEAKSISIPVEIDRKSLRRAEGEIKRIENIYKISDSKRAFRVVVTVAGASALPALVQGAASATAALTDLGRAAAVLPGLLAGIGAAIGTTAVGMKGISDAFSAAGEDAEKAADKVKDYKDATKDLAKAQRDVVEALKDANRQIEDQRDSLKSNQLSVERAALNVQRANERLAKGGFESMTEYRSAVLDQRQAVLDFDDSLKRNRRGLQDYFTTQAQGVAKSATVQDAVDRLTESVDKFGEAQKAVSNTSSDFLDALAKLSPAAQDFVVKIKSLEGAWSSLQNNVQESLFQGIGDSITDLANKRLPLLQQGMQQVAKSLNADFKQVISTLGTDINASRFETIFKNVSIALERIKPGIDSFLNAIIQLSEVGSRFMPRLAEAFNKVMGRFEAFIDRADKDGSLENWIDRGLKAWSSLGDSVLQVGRIMGAITSAYESATGNVGGFVSTMQKGLTKLADYLSSAAGQQALTGYILEAKLFLGAIKDNIPGIIDIFQAFGDAARAFAGPLFWALSKIGVFLQTHLTLAKAILATYLMWKVIKPFGVEGTRIFNRMNQGMANYKAAQKEAIAQAVQLGEVRAAAADKASKAELRAERARRLAEGAKKSSAALVPYIDTWKAERLKAISDVQRASETYNQRVMAAEAAYADQLRRTNQVLQGGLTRRGTEYKPGYVEGQKTALANRASELKAAKEGTNALETAKKNLSVAEANLSTYTNMSSKATKIAATNTADYTSEMRRSKAAMQMFDQANAQLASGGMSKLATALGRDGAGAKAGGLIGRMGALLGALGGWAVGGAISAVATGGVIFALAKLAEAHQKAGDRADYQRQREEALANTLDQTTGAVTRAALNEDVRQSQKAQITGRNNATIERNALKDATEGLGIDTETFKLSLDPTQTAASDEVRRAADKSTEDAIRSGKDRQWNDVGSRLKKFGVDERVYALAINGDLDAVGKFNAAVRLMAEEDDPLGVKIFGNNQIGIMQRTGALPELGSGAQNLIQSNVPGVSVGQFQRETVRGRIAGGDAAKAASSDRALKPGGPFPGAQDVGETPEGDGVGFVMNNLTPDQVRKYQELGVNVTPGGADGRFIISITSPELLKQFVQGYAAGGSVWGAGSSTSDSIPAMLSNGEFVVNAKAASAIGHDVLAGLNNAPYKASGGRYAPGGSVEPLPPWVTGNLLGSLNAAGYTSSNPTGASQSTLAAIGVESQSVAERAGATSGSIFGNSGSGSYTKPSAPPLGDGSYFDLLLNSKKPDAAPTGIGGGGAGNNTAGLYTPNATEAKRSSDLGSLLNGTAGGTSSKIPGVGLSSADPRNSPLSNVFDPSPIYNAAAAANTSSLEDLRNGYRERRRAANAANPPAPYSGPTPPERLSDILGQAGRPASGAYPYGSPNGPSGGPTSPQRLSDILGQAGRPTTGAYPAGSPGGPALPGGYTPLTGPQLTNPALTNPQLAPGPNPTASLNNSSLQDLVSRVKASGGNVGMAVVPLFGDNRQTLSFGDVQTGSAWSTMKIPLALAALRNNGGVVTEDMIAAITKSDNSAADRLWASLGSPAEAAGAVNALLREAGDSETIVSPAKSRSEFSAFGQANWSLANQLKFMSMLNSDASGGELLALMGQIQGDQQWGLGGIDGAQFKGGWGPDSAGNYLTRQMGIVDGPGGKYAVAIASKPNAGDFQSGNKELSSLAGGLPAALGAGSVPNIASLPPGFPTYESISDTGVTNGYTPVSPGQVSSVAQQLSQFAQWADTRPYIWGGFGDGGDGSDPAPADGLGGFDCSGLTLALANIATGRAWNEGGRTASAIGEASFWTGNQGAELTARGFREGPGGPGSLTIGWNGSHTGATLPDGTHIEAMNQANGIVMGQGSTGAANAAFTRVMHLPIGASQSVQPFVDVLAPGGQQTYIPGNVTAPPPGALDGPKIPGINAPIPGPFGDIPFDPMSILKTIGETILQAILGFFGIDISPIIDTANKIMDGMPENKNTDQVEEQVDQAVDLTTEPNLISNQLLQMSAEAKAAGNETLAKSYYDEALKQAQGGLDAQAAYNSSLPAYAAGGHVRGPGGPTSDKIPAMLSNGEYVIRAAAVRSIGLDQLHAMNKYAGGGLVLPWFDPITPTGPPPGPTPGRETAPPMPEGAGEVGKEAVHGLLALGMPRGVGSGSGTAGSPTGADGSVRGGGKDLKEQDKRGILAAAPTDDSYINPAISGAIEGAFSTAGAIANTAIQMGAAGATLGGSAAAGSMGAGQVGQLVQAGAQMAGQVASGAANVISALAVGSVTPSQTGQGYGAPLLPPPPRSPVSNFQSIHNGNVVTNNLSEYSRLKDRKDAQKAAPFFNRVNQ